MNGTLQVFCGNSNRSLAEEVAQYLAIPMGKSLVATFKNGETRVRIEQNVRGSDIFVIQPTCTPVNDHLMELLIIMDALRRSSAQRVTAVVPYYGYARQEKKTAGREPISAKLVANLIATAGADRIITIDLHASAIEGFFDIPVDHLRASPILASYFKKLGLTGSQVTVVSPDVGGVARANEFRERLGASLAIVAKQRPEPDVSEVMEMVGDVHGRTAIIVDDIISTGGTLAEAADMMMRRGALEVYAAATHGIFAATAGELVHRSALKKVVVTNTVPVPNSLRDEKIEVLTVAPLLAEAIKRIHLGESVSDLFV
jgi:ribose-phosphate pyrophosphokinase